MATIGHAQTKLTATVVEVLPKFGIGYFVDDEHRTWPVTRNTDGPGLENLQAGQRATLTLVHHVDFTTVSDYSPLDRV
jgi:hypothetical protein